MDFNLHRLQAARDARRLWLLYAIAVLGVVGVFNGSGWLIWRWLFGETPLPIGFWGINVLATAGLTIGGSLIELTRLDRHPDTVAQRLGARLIEPAGRSLRFDERRLVNVVEEMALAARQPVPRIYLLDREPSINALATGLTPEASAIIVSDGALMRLSRDELQGVVAHEIAHIASGDVAVSTRVAALNAGLELVSDAGRHFRAAGAILVVCGFAGHFAATLIAAAMSRNREFHADALAVELTREPGGLARALRKAWWLAEAASKADANAATGSAKTQRASKLAAPAIAGFRGALFDGSSLPASWVRTHPPLPERIARLHGFAAGPLAADATHVEPGASIAHAGSADANDGSADANEGRPVADERAAAARWLAHHALPPLDYAVALVDAAGRVDQARGRPDAAQVDSVPSTLATLIEATQEASDAAALAMLLVTGTGADAIAWPPRWRIAAARQAQLAAHLRRLPSATIQALRWPLLERCAASLRGLAHPWPQELLGTMRARIELDQRVTLSEWIYYMLLRIRMHGDTPAACRGDEPEIDPAQAVRWVVMLLARVSALPELRAQRAANELIRAVGLARTTPTTPALDVGGLQTAVASLRRIGMLQRPLLMRALVSFLPVDAPIEARDFLRILSLVIDTPIPAFDARSADCDALTRAQAIPAT